MARLPVLHKRQRSKGQRALDMAKGAATVWTTVKASSAAGRAAKKGARVAGRPMVKLLALPVAVGGATIVWRKMHSTSDETTPEAARPLGPVASADTVSPPATNAADAAAAADAPTEAHASQN